MPYSDIEDQNVGLHSRIQQAEFDSELSAFAVAHMSAELGTLKDAKRMLEMRLRDKERECIETTKQLEVAHTWLHESRPRNVQLTAAVFHARGLKVQKGFSMVPV